MGGGLLMSECPPSFHRNVGFTSGVDWSRSATLAPDFDAVQVLTSRPLPSELGIYMIAKARFWLELSGKSPETFNVVAISIGNPSSHGGKGGL